MKASSGVSSGTKLKRFRWFGDHRCRPLHWYLRPRESCLLYNILRSHRRQIRSTYSMAHLGFLLRGLPFIPRYLLKGRYTWSGEPPDVYGASRQCCYRDGHAL